MLSITGSPLTSLTRQHCQPCSRKNSYWMAGVLVVGCSAATAPCLAAWALPQLNNHLGGNVCANVSGALLQAVRAQS